jgi:hypothetical protein
MWNAGRIETVGILRLFVAFFFVVDEGALPGG